jgi:hypothetical protein
MSVPPVPANVAYEPQCKCQDDDGPRWTQDGRRDEDTQERQDLV